MCVCLVLCHFSIFVQGRLSHCMRRGVGPPRTPTPLWSRPCLICHSEVLRITTTVAISHAELSCRSLESLSISDNVSKRFHRMDTKTKLLRIGTQQYRTYICNHSNKYYHLLVRGDHCVGNCCYYTTRLHAVAQLTNVVNKL